MNTLGVQVKETIAMKDRMGQNPPKRQYCCSKMEFVAGRLKKKICPFCNEKL